MAAVSIASSVPAVAVAVAVPSRRIDRIAGAAGLAFALIVGAVNVAVGSMTPPALDAGASNIVSFVSTNASTLKVLSGAVPFGAVALFVFLASVYGRLAAGPGNAAVWTRVGAAGILLVEITFLTRMMFEQVLIANVDTLAGEPTLVETLWQLQGAAMIVTGLGLGLVLTGFSRAALMGGLIPTWQAVFGFGAAAAFLVAAVSAVASLEGSPIGLLGFLGFVSWLVWLAMTSVRLLRTPEA